ncbi:putative fatty acid-binding protein 2, liver [Apostichopus japonicus]|uniref:Putative fatty acid-binding protein 2, liver n=1 Tax=Stichopus japonicus TaxID=307972 RepID=A0A2G8KMT2_STIJA|nr:putative fatty acid-binding protein 2, liver [Apostichopus japonicus]
MAAAFEGKWVFDRSEGMDAIVGALSLPADKVPKSGQTTLEYKISGNSFTINGTHPKSGKALSSTFTIGEKFKADELSAYLGKDVYATPSWTGSKLVVSGEGGQGSLTREVVNGELVTTFTFGGASGKRIFKKA